MSPHQLHTALRSNNVPPARISLLLVKTPRPEEDKHLERMALRRLTEDDVPQLGSASLEDIPWSPVSGFNGLEHDVVIVAGVTDVEADWHRGIAYVGMSRAHAVACDYSRRLR